MAPTAAPENWVSLEAAALVVAHMPRRLELEVLAGFPAAAAAAAARQ
jgi:hypothetical protein